MSTPERIAVVGATGRLGSQLVDVLEARGHDVVKASRTHGVDVISKEGLADALAGTDVIVDAATQPTPDMAAAADFFTTSTANLHEAGHAAGVERMITLSIIGADQFDTGFIGSETAHEAAALAGPVPTDIVRASQFHEFVTQLLDWCTQGDVAYVPKMRTQPVACRALSEAIADLVDESAEGGQMFEVAGPQEELLPDLIRLLIEAEGRPIEVETVVDPVDGERHEQGALLPGPAARLVGPTYADWLAAG